MDDKIIRMQILDLAKAVDTLLYITMKYEDDLFDRDFMILNNLKDSIQYIIEED